jgi:acetyl-CoA carboxylase biotin carboxyl carrier protein
VNLAAVAREQDSGEIALLAPKIGFFCDPLPPGTPVAPGSVLGALVQLSRRFSIVAPQGVAGVVSGLPPRDRRRAVGYGEVLLSVSPVSALARSTAARNEDASTAPGTHRVVAPTDGVFYPAAAPGAAPFAPKGARLVLGQTIGLIEVMKTFNPIVYGGGTLPESAEVVEVLAGEGEEVRAGQGLLVVR